MTGVLAGDRRWTFSHCPMCGGAIDLDTTSPPMANRDGVDIEFWFCRCCHTLLPAGSDGADSDDRETTRQAEYHRRLWEEVDFEQLDRLAATAMPLALEFAKFLGRPDEEGAIVDIGAGRGNILHAVRRLRYRVAGCEPSAALCEVARSAYLLGPEILQNRDAETFLSRLAADGDAVSGFILWHVLEHLRDPMTLLRRCLEIAPRARFFIELPLAISDDVFAEHLFFPTPRTLQWLAEVNDLNIQLLQITGDRRLRVFYGDRPPDEDNQPARLPTTDLTVAGDRRRQLTMPIGQLEEIYASLSPVFNHFSTGVISHAHSA